MRKIWILFILLIYNIFSAFADPSGVGHYKNLSGIVTSVQPVKEGSEVKLVRKQVTGTISPIKEGSEINIRDSLITNSNTVASIQIAGLTLTLTPNTVVELWIAYIKENRIYQIWDIERGEVLVKFATEDNPNSKIAFNTKEGNSVLITGTEFTLNYRGVVQVFDGGVCFYDRNFFRVSKDFEKAAQIKPLTSLEEGQAGNGKTKPVEIRIKQKVPQNEILRFETSTPKILYEEDYLLFDMEEVDGK